MSNLAIELKKVKKQFRLGGEVLEVLKGISFRVEAGEFVTIMGPSGSGKSTLLNILGCLDVPTSGEYFIEKEDVSKKNESELSDVRAKKIGFVFQNFNLISGISALKNVLLPQFYVDDENVSKGKKLLNLVGLKDRMGHKPMEMSGGQRQRVAIARALINDPAIILADEPTGNLDSKTGKEILDLLRDLNKQGRTIIMVTHDKYVADYSDRLIGVVDGLITDKLDKRFYSE